MRTATMFLAGAALMLSATACKKKAEPPEPVVEAPPPEPEPEPEPPPPPACTERKALQGSWYVTTQVADDVGGRLAGVNGFYRLSVFKTEDGCQTKFLITKEGWGRGELAQVQSLLGETLAEFKDGWWQISADLTGEGEPTQIVFWITQEGESLDGFWHYTANSWGRSPVYGVLEGGRDAIYRQVSGTPEGQDALDRCGLAVLPATTPDQCAR